MTALLSPPLQDIAATRGPHANAKSVRLSSTPVIRLKGTLQTLGSLKEMSRYASSSKITPPAEPSQACSGAREERNLQITQISQIKRRNRRFS